MKNLFTKISIMSGIIVLAGLSLMLYTEPNYTEVRTGFLSNISAILFSGGIFLFVLNLLFETGRGNLPKIMNNIWTGPDCFNLIWLAAGIGIMFGQITLGGLFNFFVSDSVYQFSGYGLFFGIASPILLELIVFLIGYYKNPFRLSEPIH
ncbi:MAG TPA: hypothetical protein PK886_01795 [Candidatus Paceibacterota bacterium]|nr:hypothetical protein [Candidatus Paceibacterota bacterium]